jgi:hypothetical protein
MKKIKFLSILTVLFLTLIPSVSSACIQKLKAAKTTVKKGDTIKVTASIKWIHHPCVLDTDDVNFKFTGLKKVGKIKWKKKGRGRYKATFKVKITSSKKAVIKMWRECSKTGKHGTQLVFTVK